MPEDHQTDEIQLFMKSQALSSETNVLSIRLSYKANHIVVRQAHQPELLSSFVGVSWTGSIFQPSHRVSFSEQTFF